MVANKRNSGFTLLELLVALAIGALIITAAYGAFFSLNRAQQVVSKDMAERRSLRTVLDLMRRELSSTLYKNNDKKLRFLVEDRDFFGKPASNLSFASIAPPLDGTVSDQVLLQYKVIESEERLILTRSAKDYFMEDERRTNYPVLEQLDGFLVECFDGSKWLKNWDTAVTPVLPKAIRITYSVRDKDRTVVQKITATPRVKLQ